MTAGARILIVDDDPGMSETLGDVLERKGHTVQTAARGRVGLDIVAASPIEAAIVDIGLPDMSGIDVLRSARRLSPSMEVILITGHASLGTAIQAIHDLAFAYLVKPFEMSHLLATIEQALRKQRLTQALLESEERYRLVTESITDAVFLLDAEGQLVWSNPRGLEITGYDEAELRGRSLMTLFTPEGGAALLAGMEATWTGENRARFFEAEVIRRDGGRVLAEAQVSCVLKDGRPVARLAALRDITERKKLEEQLRQAQKMEAIGRLAGGVAHDFNNLLTVIGGRCHLMINGLPAGDPLRRDIELIRGASERAAQLTHQLLAFSRRQVLEPKVLDLNVTLGGIEALLRRMIGEDIQVMITPGGALGRVKADPGQVEQVILNLAVNARDAMPLGGRLTIETSNADGPAPDGVGVSRATPGHYVVLAVGDTGHGMSAETQAHIFEPFFTTKDPGKGTGLGLSTVYGIVEQSGGHIAVQSAPGRGTTFRIYLPRVDAAPVSDQSPPEVAVAPKGTETVLLVEDDEGLRSLAREVLTVLGYTVLDAGHPADAVSLAESYGQTIHLLLTDVIMPQMNGRQLAEALLATRPALRVLYMSGYTAGAIGAGGVLEPGVHFLQKPFTPLGLGRKVREVLTV
jgi:two-component system, cell cycle sensor histidine kinase and response regulator CckA